MYLSTRNVNTAFYSLVHGFQKGSFPGMGLEVVSSSSRNGDVLKASKPTVIEFTNPKERVLLNKARRINPFFFLYESMWMLNGSNYLKPLAFFNKTMKEFSDDGETLNGAYGYRWRRSKGDQIHRIIQELETSPDSRRAVLQMWMVDKDLNKIKSSKDVCCNLSALFSIRFDKDKDQNVLDMTVFNRSNDLIWGALGANYVHFTFLQEYIAGSLKLDVGNYYQVSNNLHVYSWNWEPEVWLSYYEGKCGDNPHLPYSSFTPYPDNKIIMFGKTVEEFSRFNRQLQYYMAIVSDLVGSYGENKNSLASKLDNSYQEFCEHYTTLDFFKYLVMPMTYSFFCYKLKDLDKSYKYLDLVKAEDWKKAGLYFLQGSNAPILQKV